MPSETPPLEDIPTEFAIVSQTVEIRERPTVVLNASLPLFFQPLSSQSAGAFMDETEGRYHFSRIGTESVPSFLPETLLISNAGKTYGGVGRQGKGHLQQTGRKGIEKLSNCAVKASIQVDSNQYDLLRTCRSPHSITFWRTRGLKGYYLSPLFPPKLLKNSA